MGVGKSTIGKRLAELRSLAFIDLDIFIESKLNMPISSVFKEKGEEFFREEEYKAILDLLEKKDSIIALGGGSLEHHKLDSRIRNSALVIYLEASPEFLYNRLKEEKETRPLIATMQEDELLSFIQKHLASRTENYLKAQLRIDVDNKSVDEIASTISEYLDLF